jgi:hypothetical protein
LHGVVDHGVVHYGPIGLLAAIEQYACSVGNAPDLAAWAVSFASANSDIVSIASADAEL